MESLIGYGSDDDYDEHSHGRKQTSSQADANYEEVQMDLSEDSNDSTKFDNRRQSKDYHSKYKDDSTKNRDYKDKDKYKKQSEDDRYKHEHSRSSPKYQDTRNKDRNRDRKSRDRGEWRSREREDRRSREREERRSRERDDRRSRDKEDHDRHSWEDEREDRDYKKDRSRDEKARYRDRDNRRGKEDYREDRHSHRGSSRERHRSRSPKRSKRSASRERTRGGYSKRYDRSGNKMDRLEKLGIDFNSGLDSAGTSTEGHNDKTQEKDRFFMPGITGRFTEQIQRRKLLWQKKEVIPTAEVISPTQTQKVWQNTTFAQDTDGKVANKFKRLMGIRGSQSSAPKPANDNLRKQEEMFTSMEAQYEVARTATHTMRGVGLGFGAFQR